MELVASMSAPGIAPPDTAPEAQMARLVARAQEGSAKAFEQLYRLHVNNIYGICLRMVADPTQAEILTQDAFVRAKQTQRVRANKVGLILLGRP